MTAYSNITDSQSIDDVMEDLGRGAKSAAQTLSLARTDAKNKALTSAAASMRKNSSEILSANDKDMAAAATKGLNAAMLDRLKLTDGRIESMAKGLEDIAVLKDPIGDVIAEWDFLWIRFSRTGGSSPCLWMFA